MTTEKQYVQFLDGEPVIFCPGCQQLHKIWVNKPNDLTSARWQWNCDQASPTFSPSILVKFTKGPTEEEHAEYRKTGFLPPPRDMVCHFFVTAGQLHYCHDCTHELAGKVVPMVELDPTTLDPVGVPYV